MTGVLSQENIELLWKLLLWPGAEEEHRSLAAGRSLRQDLLTHAEALGLADQCIFVCPVTVIDPKYDDNDPRLVTTIFDPFEGAEYLTWKRSKKSA